MGGPRSAQGFCVVVLNVVEQLVAAGGSSPLPAPRCDGVLRWVRAGLWLWPWLPCVKQNQLLYLKQKGKTTEKTRLLFGWRQKARNWFLGVPGGGSGPGVGALGPPQLALAGGFVVQTRCRGIFCIQVGIEASEGRASAG